MTFSRFRLPMRWRKFIAVCALIVVGGLAWLYVQVDMRAQTDTVRSADAIIVLGSAVWQGERASPSLDARTRHAIALYQAGYAPRLIFSGGLGKNPPSEAEVMQRIAVRAGVPAQAIVLEDQSHSTEENLRNSKALMEARGWRTAIIVSDPFHILRAETLARDLGLNATGSGARASPSYTTLPTRVWYTARESLALVWYYATRVTGEPTWLYAWLKERQQTSN
ncbi:MAG: YdcF family protein [Chloroflexi bacterium]|nr:YdcF family protein [Chloroflexota bacterium]